MTAAATDLATLAERIARDAGSLLLDQATRAPVGVAVKSTPTDPVSAADRGSEALIGAALAAARPDDAILGEEGAARAGTSGIRWVVDPLDGTVNYLYRLPIWSVSVACEDDDGGLAACVYDPNRDEAFVAARGAGATLNGAPVAVGTPASLALALVGTGFSYDRDHRAAQALVATRVLAHARDIRRGGSAALDLCWVACGRLDAYYETGINRWDWLGGALVAQEAGARLVVRPDHDRTQVVAAAPAIADELLSVVSS